MFSTQQSQDGIKVAGLTIAAAIVAVTFYWSSLKAAPVNVRQVSLYVNVEKDDGLIKGLRDENFRLYEDDRSRSFRLEPLETPAVIALLLEYGSNYIMFHEDLDAVMQAFVDKAPDENWYSLATFSHGLTVNVDFTKEKGRLTQAYSQLGPPEWNETDTYDAVFSMLDKMSRLPGRRVLIVAGAGLDSFSAHNLDDVEKKLESADVTVYAIGLGSALRGAYQPYLDSIQSITLLQGQSFLQMLASDSGGQAWFPNLEGAYSDVVEGTMQDLATQYRLVYDSQVPADGKLPKNKDEAVQVVNDKRSNFKVRVRKGWRF